MFDCKLTPAYCLFNGAAILEQHGSEIIFLLENLDDVVLQGRLKRAFKNYLDSVRALDDCPGELKEEMRIDFVKGNRDQLRRCVSGLYKAGVRVGDEQEQALFLNGKENEKNEAAAVLLLDSILHDARSKKATDIHIEKNCVRFRINGRLERGEELVEERVCELVQRIKLLAGMNVIEKHRCQDGRFVYGSRDPIFVRVSTVPVIGKNYLGSESLVMRLLDTSRVPLDLKHLGFNEDQLCGIDEILKAKNGLVLVCGPTGAGKSTTVAAVLLEMEKRESEKLKIISMEDPPEYVIPGVSQIQVDENHFTSYDEALAHVFRQDPDVIMIGEIRDEITAGVALRAALTGHLVFATLHTSGPGEAILRLENLGLERKLLASILRATICQELDYKDEEIFLCADLAIPKAKFGSLVEKFMSEEELDDLFIHLTNFSEAFNKTLDDLKSGKYKRKVLLPGGMYGQKIHKRIG